MTATGPDAADTADGSRSAPAVAVVDIDGVVADVRHRLSHLEGRRRNWDAFFAAADRDPPLPEGLRLVGDLAGRHRIVWLTGRPERLRRVTRAWLAGHGLPADELIMRRAGDHRPARVVKLERLARLSQGAVVAAFVDDDSEVVDAALAAGYPAVLADWVVRTGPQDAALSAAQRSEGRT